MPSHFLTDIITVFFFKKNHFNPVLTQDVGEALLPRRVGGGAQLQRQQPGGGRAAGLELGHDAVLEVALLDGGGGIGVGGIGGGVVAAAAAVVLVHALQLELPGRRGRRGGGAGGAVAAVKLLLLLLPGWRDRGGDDDFAAAS